MVSLEFFIDMILPAHYDRGVDSASKRNEYQEYFFGELRSVRRAANLPPSCAEGLKIWDLNLLEPAGPVKACNRIALQCKL
jgi:hypothetical protein